ncbi:MAG: pyruvate kinase [Rhodospirillales bacterium]|nr:pyruvate kinase [Rhodospirillales bacterium]
MRRQRTAKILATLGPASGSPERIEELFRAGADVFRLNFSHGGREDHKKRVAAIRALEERIDRPIGVLMDLQGPKLRIGEFAGGKAELVAGAPFRLDLDPTPGDATRVGMPHPEIFQALKEGADILINDGRFRLRVLRHGADFAETQVITGGEISDHKGVNLPNLVLPLSALTPKDKDDLEFGLALGVDWVALSFVQRPEDVIELKRRVAGRAGVLAKLEKPSAVAPDTLAGIIAEADAIMVARGDLGVECPPEDVPVLQKQIIAACRLAGKPVVVATQMLETMIHAPTPTRAEASDVATAIYDGADTVMLSAETAAGDYPVEAVTMMDRIIRRVERDPLFARIREADHPAPEHTTQDAIATAARHVAHTIAAAAIVTYTSSGSSAFRAARERPDVPILGLTPKPATARRLTLAWGVHAVHTPDDIHDTSEMVALAVKAASVDFAKPGDHLVILAGMPFGTAGTTNMLRVAKI